MPDMQDNEPLKASCVNCVSCRVSRLQDKVDKMEQYAHRDSNRIILLEDTQNEVSLLKRIIDAQQNTINNMIDRIRVLEDK